MAADRGALPGLMHDRYHPPVPVAARSAVISHLLELTWAFSLSTRRVQTQVPPVAAVATVAHEWPDGGQRRF